jgi:hypothetical protein
MQCCSMTAGTQTRWVETVRTGSNALYMECDCVMTVEIDDRREVLQRLAYRHAGGGVCGGGGKGEGMRCQ